MFLPISALSFMFFPLPERLLWLVILLFFNGLLKHCLFYEVSCPTGWNYLFYPWSELQNSLPWRWKDTASSVLSLAIHDSLDKFQTLHIIYKTFPTLAPCLSLLLSFLCSLNYRPHEPPCFPGVEHILLHLRVFTPAVSLFTCFTFSHFSYSLQRLLLVRGFLHLSKPGGLCYMFSQHSGLPSLLSYLHNCLIATFYHTASVKKASIVCILFISVS